MQNSAPGPPSGERGRVGEVEWREVEWREVEWREVEWREVEWREVEWRTPAHSTDVWVKRGCARCAYVRHRRVGGMILARADVVGMDLAKIGCRRR